MNPYAPDPALEWANRVILRVEVGSTAHGTGNTETEDYDEIGVMLIPWQQAIGVPVLSERDETIVYRPGRATGERSQAGDYDLNVHSARKFARLAAQGNPSLLTVLYGPVTFERPLGRQLINIRDAFWSQRARWRFLGYMRAQRERLEGVRGGAHTNRPELAELHGYDTKYAMHMLRLGFQGLEYMTTGAIQLPMRPDHRALLLNVRAGKISYSDVLNIARSLEADLESTTTEAPPEPNWNVINLWLLGCFDVQRGVA